MLLHHVRVFQFFFVLLISAAICTLINDFVPTSQQKSQHHFFILFLIQQRNFYFTTTLYQYILVRLRWVAVIAACTVLSVRTHTLRKLGISYFLYVCFEPVLKKLEFTLKSCGTFGMHVLTDLANLRKHEISLK